MTRWTTILFFISILTSRDSHGQTDNYPGLVKLIIGTHKIYGGYKILGTEVVNGTDLSHCKSDTVVFKFYKSPTDNSVARQLSFYFDWSKIPRVERIIEKDYNSWLHPVSGNDDTTNGYYHIFFNCKSKRGSWLEIITNEQTKETMWIKDARFVRLLSWRKLGKKEIVCIKPRSKLYNQPDTSSTTINFQDNDNYSIVKTKGNWMKLKVQTGDLCGSSSDKIYFGWTNFKSTDKLLIDIQIW